MFIKPFTKLSILLLLVGIALGLFLTAQWRAKPSRVTSPILPYTSLRETREILQSENENLKKQISDLQNQINQDQELVKKAKVTSSSSIDELERLKDQIALTSVKGDGVRIVLADSTSGSATTDSIVHASDLRDIINLLWSSKASAIAINDQRVSASTSIDCIVNTILINNARLTSPFKIEAIGKSSELFKTLTDPNILIDLQRRTKLGLQFEVKTAKNITLPVFNGSYNIQFAKIEK
ncbi:MAG: DUF881 domain-containing protein [Candidatus Berkelbacteria bacterium]|nr:DUF881 domain-containing protein [Candidatus Berkelbacteria bacterium]